MPTYRITYNRKDMGHYPCKAIKTAHTEKEAIACLCTGTEKKGYRLTKSGVPVKIVNIQQL